MRIALSMLLLAAAAVSAGCESGPTAEDLRQQLEDSLADVKDAVKDLAPVKERVQSGTLEELEKLHKLEYRIVEVPFDTASKDIESLLSKLGDDRWDCFHVERRDDNYLVMCKRFPKSYLRYIPRVF